MGGKMRSVYFEISTSKSKTVDDPTSVLLNGLPKL